MVLATVTLAHARLPAIDVERVEVAAPPPLTYCSSGMVKQLVSTRDLSRANIVMAPWPVVALGTEKMLHPNPGLVDDAGKCLRSL